MITTVTMIFLNQKTKMKKISKRQQTYLANKDAKVGTEITCPVCQTSFIKKQWSQAFCCSKCKDAYWNAKTDRHSSGYYKNYNESHPKRLERVGIFKDDVTGKLGHYDSEGNFWTFEEERDFFDMCENPIEGR